MCSSAGAAAAAVAAVCDARVRPKHSTQQAIQAQLNNLAAGLSQASSGVQTVVESIQQGFPGPMLQSTLDGIRQQVGGCGLNAPNRKWGRFDVLVP